MARKKEYSLADGQAKKHKPQQITSNDTHFNHDGTAWNQKPVKHKEQNSGASSSGGKVYDVGPLRAQLGSFGLTLRDIPGDGNCLFRALGDQLEGHSMNHLKHRMDTVRYMIAHRHHFEPFVDVPFERYMENLSRAGTYAGQDAIVAFARLHQVNVVIHQLNSPLWHIQGSEGDPTAELHLSYHNGEHYSSVRRFGDIANTPPHIRIVSQLTGASEVPCCVSHSMCTPSAPVTSHIGNMPCSNYLTVPPPHPVPNPSQRSRGFIHNEDDFTLLIDEVMERSGCGDSVIATEAFVDNGGDVDQAVDYLLSLSFLIDPIDKNLCDARQERQHKDVYRRVSGRRSAGAESNERIRLPTNKHLSRTTNHNSIRVMAGTEPESGLLKQKSTTTVGSQPESGWESSLEGDLRFLTL